MATRILPAVMLSAMIALASGASRANLILDGNFSLDTQGFHAVGATLGSGAWTVTTGTESNTQGYSGVDLSQTYWQAPPGGGNSVDLDGYYPGGISQSFATTVGNAYWINFYLAGNPSTSGSPTPIKTVRVTAGGTAQQFTFNTSTTSDTAMGYVLETLGFTATSATTTLAFTSLDPGTQSSGPVIGGINVEQAPEPASLALLVVGALGIGMARRRRPNSASC